MMFRKQATIDKLIEILNNLSKQGYGDYIAMFDDQYVAAIDDYPVIDHVRNEVVFGTTWIVTGA